MLLPHLPKGLTLDTYKGSAWVSVQAFWVERLRHRLSPPIPGVSGFGKVLVRTYVTTGLKAGLWVFGVECSNPIVVRAARMLFGSRQSDADIMLEGDNVGVDLASTRRGTSGEVAEFDAVYRPVGPIAPQTRGGFLQWMHHRYCVYSVGSGGRLMQTEYDFQPWPWQPAQVTVRKDSLIKSHGLNVPGSPNNAFFCQRSDVQVWSPIPA